MVHDGRNGEIRRMAKHNTMFESPSTKQHLAALGLSKTASWEDIERAYRSLVSDLTPGPEAGHRNVELALSMLHEVNAAFSFLSVRRVA